MSTRKKIEESKQIINSLKTITEDIKVLLEKRKKKIIQLEYLIKEIKIVEQDGIDESEDKNEDEEYNPGFRPNDLKKRLLSSSLKHKRDI